MTEEDFYEYICQGNGESEIVRLIKHTPQCGFYNLCQTYVDIALNAKTFNDNNSELKRLFLHEDINVAKKASLEFCMRNNIKDIDELFRIIKSEFHNSINPNDTRRTEAMIKEDGRSMNTYGYIGTLYFFNDISDDVYVKIVSEIKQSILTRKKLNPTYQEYPVETPVG